MILQLQDTCTRVCSIWNFTVYNSVHTEKWKSKTDPRCITIPKRAWQDTLHLHVHNAMYKLIVHFTQRTEYMLYSMENSYLPDCGGYEFSVALLLHWCSVPPPSIASTSFLYLCLCNACAGCPTSQGKTRIYISVPASFLCPNFLPGHVRGTALNPCSQLYWFSWSSSGCGWERVWR